MDGFTVESVANVKKKNITDINIFIVIFVYYFEKYKTFFEKKKKKKGRRVVKRGVQKYSIRTFMIVLSGR